MKRLFYCFIIFSMVIAKGSKGQGRAPIGLDWMLTNTDKDGMLSRLSECGFFKPCHNNSKIMDPDNEEYRWIVATYSATSTITKIDARYRDADEPRYRRLRGLQDPESSRVKGFKTVIVKVEPRHTGLLANTEVIYFDFFFDMPAA